MDLVMGGLTWPLFLLACLVTLAGGVVKGAIGFALPMVMIAAFANFMPPELMLCAVIITVMTTNIQQALRDGLRPALQAMRDYWRALATMVLGIFISAPLINVLPQRLFIGLLALAILSFTVLQLSGWRPVIPRQRRGIGEVVAGLVGGLYGGVSGIWGPPFVLFLLAIRAEKQETIRVLGAVFLIGGATLFLAHLQTGVVNRSTLPFAFAMLVPAGIGMWLGFQLQDKLDAERFRKGVLLVLGVVGLNLAVRALLG